MTVLHLFQVMALMAHLAKQPVKSWIVRCVQLLLLLSLSLSSSWSTGSPPGHCGHCGHTSDHRSLISYRYMGKCPWYRRQFLCSGHNSYTFFSVYQTVLLFHIAQFLCAFRCCNLFVCVCYFSSYVIFAELHVDLLLFLTLKFWYWMEMWIDHLEN